MQSLSTYKWLGLLGLVATLVILIGLMPQDASRVQGAGTFQTGDVFAGVGGGQVWRYSPAGVLLQKLETHAGCIGAPLSAPCSEVETGMCFDASGNLYTTNWTAGTMSKFTNSDVAGGQLLNDSLWGSGFRYRPETCVHDASTHIYTGEVQCPGCSAGHAGGSGSPCTVPSPCNQIRRFVDDNAGTSSSPPPFATSPAIQNQGTDWIDLSADQCTMLYTSEGDTVKSFNVCTGLQGPDFRTGLTGDCYALRIRPNGEVMVACRSQVYRLNSSGGTIQTYTTASVGGSNFFALNLDPDGVTFWTAGYGGDIFRINITTPGISPTAYMTTFTAPGQGATDTDGSSPSMAGLAVYGEQTVGGSTTPTPSPAPPTPTPTPTPTPPTQTPTPTPPTQTPHPTSAVGGLVALPVAGSGSPVPWAPLAAVAAGVMAVMGAGFWYGRRRWQR